MNSNDSRFKMGNWNVNGDGVALGGYDVVGYHEAHEAVRGNASNAAEHDGATFFFTTPERRDAFRAAPEKYLPRFGGHCAFAMAAKNAVAPADPQTFKLYQGSLLLFFNDYYEGNPFNTIVPWNQNEADMFARAEANWPAHA